ncbi:hypothetical protein CAPTEDRAFT_206593 [Capitella teleta]|uniref:Uncharacterized protein n=1 Tax=Capitella teleta TaxID=283909 RepID=R7U3C7_CAPTE|nr:hypothetical protein CAPTEDRAFT_206593 [Capitella teleta]|eukprot:ELU00626.1 hypothetical protein CAPTEDRAFT_206593 [Capitella teleta]
MGQTLRSENKGICFMTLLHAKMKCATQFTERGGIKAVIHRLHYADESIKEEGPEGPLRSKGVVDIGPIQHVNNVYWRRSLMRIWQRMFVAIGSDVGFYGWNSSFSACVGGYSQFLRSEKGWCQGWVPGVGARGWCQGLVPGSKGSLKTTVRHALCHTFTTDIIFGIPYRFNPTVNDRQQFRGIYFSRWCLEYNWKKWYQNNSRNPFFAIWHKRE